jgi:holo-[acyl-carrier protein] synthase
MILGIGVDIIEINRFEQGVAKEAFLRKVFTPKEIKECRMSIHASKRFAEKFAIKEAFMKAIGAGIHQQVWFTNIEVLQNRNGQLKIFPQKKAKQYFDELMAKSIHIDYSSSKGMVIGVVILVD